MEPIIVTKLQAGQRLDHLLATERGELSRSRLQALVRAGHIRVNDAAVRPGAKLKAGDAITIEIPEAIASEIIGEEIPLHILHEDADLIVLNKPPGLVVHPAVGNMSGTLVNALLHHCTDLSGIGGTQRPGIVHRLDKDTSGCLVVAKNDHAHHFLARQFAGRSIEKIYLALVSGHPQKSAGIIEAPIARHPVHRQKMAIVERGRPARTDYAVLRQYENCTLVRCRLHTGRTHQIRVHWQHLGHPLMGDPVYGKPRGYARQMLHAWRLVFEHPRTLQRMKFTAPVPDDFPPDTAAIVESQP